VDLLSLSSGWAGADQMSVTIGGPIGQGTDVADGIVGEARTDVADLLGSGYARNSGFTATVNASALQIGQNQMWINLHTPHGWYYKTRTVTVNQAQNLQYPTDPIVALLEPAPFDQFKTGGNGTVNGPNATGPGSNIEIFGFALDRNVNNIINTGNTSTGDCGSGVTGTTVYLDYGTPSQRVINSSPCVNASNGRVEHGATGASGLASPSRANGESVNGYGSTNAPSPNVVGGAVFKSNPCPACSYGQQFMAAHFIGALDAAAISIGPHTLQVKSTSTESGNVGWSQVVTFRVEAPNP
jgi:hypothetical protein